MSYNPPDIKNELDELNRKIGIIRNISRSSSVGINLDTAAFGAGSSAAVSGKNHGVQFFTPQTYVVTVDGSNRRHIALSSAIAIINEYGTSSLTLHYIDGTFNNGQFVMIRPLAGKTLTLKKATTFDNTTGNLYLDSDTILNENDFITLVFMNDLGTGGGMYAEEVGSSGSGLFANQALSNLTSPTAINQDLIFGDGTTLSQGKNLINIGTLDFRSTTAFHPYIVGNGSNNQFNIGAHGSDIIILQNAFNSVSGIPDNGILEVFGTSHGVHSGVLWIPSLKTVNLSSTITNGNYVGGLYMDALDSGLTQRTFGAIFTIADSVSNPFAGRLSLQAILPNGSGLQEYMNVSNNGIGVNVDIVPSGFTTIQAGNASFPFKSVYSSSLKYLSNVISMSGNDMTYTAISSLNHKFIINSTTLLGVETDNTFGDVGYVDFYQGHRYTAATSGTASSLPSTPDGYHIVMINGVRKKIPYYNI